MIKIFILIKKKVKNLKKKAFLLIFLLILINMANQKINIHSGERNPFTSIQTGFLFDNNSSNGCPPCDPDPDPVPVNTNEPIMLLIIIGIIGIGIVLVIILYILYKNYKVRKD